ncbi:S8 family serine peptidase [Xanthomonas translucens pv. graminis]|uniref:S8 family peptidase n=1 Tax=Xanthomonas graminis TaxID=3390026 RepID=UPI0027A82934|nr:S8 family serine peptidase [Xanthomonas translucens pv. graminis]
MSKRALSCRGRRAAIVSAMLLAACAGSAAAGEIALQGLASTPNPQRFIVTYRDGVGPARSARALPLADAAGIVPARRGRALGLAALRRLATGADVVGADRALDRVEAEMLMRRLAADPAVKSVEVDLLLRPTLVPNDPGLSQQWAFGTTSAAINVRPAWDVASGKGIVVAVIDTGITTHPDLAANVLPGYDFISDPRVAGDGGGRDANATDPGDGYAAGTCAAGTPGAASSWHGTHVAGTIAAATNNAAGVAGTAFNARLLPVRALGKCGGYLSDVADAIVWASGGSVAGVPANPTPAQVINLSLGAGGACSATMASAIAAAVARGSNVVVAAGNSNSNVAGSVPANCPNVIAVAATTWAGARASFSNYGAGVDVAAPGQGILSTLNAGNLAPAAAGYASYSGTSMAAPHVAGVAALVLSASLNPLTPALLEARLKATASALPVACTLGCGAGLVNAGAAVAATLKAQTLVRGVPLGNLALKAGTSLYYQVSVPAGTPWLKLSLAGGSGNADLSLRGGSLPTDTLYGCRSIAAANAESCTLNLPAGTYYVRVKAVTAVAGVGVTASY